MKTRFFAPIITLCCLGLLGFVPRAEAREPFHGKYRGANTRQCEKAKKKRLKVPALATCVQSGPSNFDARTTVTANGGGEKLTVVLKLDSANNGTLTINGAVVAGPAPKAVPKAKVRTIKFSFKATGTAKFVGPLKQTLQFSGKYGKVPFTATGVFDLNASDALILSAKVSFKKTTPLGRSFSVSFVGKRS